MSHQGLASQHSQHILHMQGVSSSRGGRSQPPRLASTPDVICDGGVDEGIPGRRLAPSLFDGQPCSGPYLEDVDGMVLGAGEETVCPQEREDGSSDKFRGHGHQFAATVDMDDVMKNSSADPGGLWKSVKIPVPFSSLPNELLFHVLGFLDVSDLLSTSRVNQLLRRLSLEPLLHRYRLQRNRLLLPPLLSSPSRPSLAELITRSIFLTKTSIISKRLARSLVSIRLSHRLAARPPIEALVERAVLPKECVPGLTPVYVAPGLVAKRKAIEKERTKDVLRRWVALKWRGEVRAREEGMRRLEESRGVGRVWRLRRYWERVSRGDVTV